MVIDKTGTIRKIAGGKDLSDSVVSDMFDYAMSTYRIWLLVRIGRFGTFRAFRRVWRVRRVWDIRSSESKINLGLEVQKLGEICEKLRCHGLTKIRPLSSALLCLKISAQPSQLKPSQAKPSQAKPSKPSQAKPNSPSLVKSGCFQIAKS